MVQLFVPEVDEAVAERLKARARRHGRTLEAEARAILEEAAREELAQAGLSEEGAPIQRADEKGFGTLMQERFKKIGLTEEEWKLFKEGTEELRRRGKLKPVDRDE